MRSSDAYERQTEEYRELIGVTEKVVNSAQKVVEQTRKARGKDVFKPQSSLDPEIYGSHGCTRLPKPIWGPLNP